MVIKNWVEHPALAALFTAAERAGLEASEPHTITVLKDRGHSIVYRLAGTGPRGTTVIAKHCSPESARIESAVYRDILPRLDIPSLALHGCIRETDGRCWLFIEDAGENRYSYHSEQHRVMAGRWLGRVHSAASRLGAPACLPERGPAWYLAELNCLVKDIQLVFSNPLIGPADLRTLEAILRQCTFLESRWHLIEWFCKRVPRTLVHGDLAAKNTRVRTNSDGEAFFALDWETAGWGTPAVDLAQFTAHSLSPDLVSWRSAFEYEFIDAETVSRLAGVGRIFRLIVAMSWEKECLAGMWPARAMRNMTLYHAALADCIQAARQEAQWLPA